MQIFHLRHICTADAEFQLNYSKLRINLTEQGHKEQEINKSIQRTQTFDRNELLKEKKKKKTNRIRLIRTYNRTLPNMKKVTVNN